MSTPVASPSPPHRGAPRGLRVALVLGGGGSVGAAYHAGVLSSLLIDLGWDAREAELVVGTSAGALVGAMVGLGVPSDDIAAVFLDARLREAPLALAEANRGPGPFPTDWRRRLIRPLRRPPPRAALRAVRRFWALGDPGALVGALAPLGEIDLEVLTGVLRREDASWPEGLRVCAVDADTLRRRVFGAPDRSSDGSRAESGALRGEARAESWESSLVPLDRAVAASCAVPGLVRPVEIGGRRYLDGGVHSASNADVVVAEAVAGRAFDLVVVSSPMSGGRLRRGPLAPMRMIAGRALRREVARLRAAGLPVVVFEPSAELAVEMGGDLLARGLEARIIRHSLIEAGAHIRHRSNRALLAGLSARAC